jgi:RNA polymerase sigma factor (sigma-70 family)
MSDKELWLLLRQGDAQAFETIYKLYAKTLHKYGMRFGLDTAQVSDCLHDIFVEIWRKRSELTADINNINFYLIKSLRRRLLRINQQQQNITLLDSFTDNNLDFELAHDTLIIESETTQERYTLLNNAFNQLSSRQREALYLRYYQNLSYQEVAQIMDLEQQSAYNLIFRGIEALRKSLGGLWFLLIFSFLYIFFNQVSKY